MSKNKVWHQQSGLIVNLCNSPTPKREPAVKKNQLITENYSIPVFNLISDEILQLIFSFLDSKALANIIYVCRRFLNSYRDVLIKNNSEASFLGASKDEIRKYYSNSNQEEFGKAFAKSIFTNNNFFFSILKEIADNVANSLKPDYQWIYNPEKDGDGPIFEKVQSGEHEFWGKSLLYFAIEQNKLELAFYLIDCIKNDDRYPISRKKARERDPNIKDIPFTKKDLVNLGYATYESGSNASSPLTLCLQARRPNETIVTALVELGGKVFAHDYYWQIPSFTGHGESPNELIIYVLKRECKVYKKLLKASNQENENLLKQLKILKLENKKLRDLYVKSKPKKRKRAENKKEIDITKTVKLQKVAPDSIFSKKETQPESQKSTEGKRASHGN